MKRRREEGEVTGSKESGERMRQRKTRNINFFSFALLPTESLHIAEHGALERACVCKASDVCMQL